MSQQGLDLIFDHVLSGGEVFRDRNLLRHDYVPDNLPHRGEQIERLGSILAPALSKDRVSNLFVYGKTGTGKTIVTRFVLEHLRKKAKEHARSLETGYVNCRLAGTNYRVLADLCHTLGRDVPFTGLAVGELLNRLRQALRARCSPFLVVLDEIDVLVRRSEDDSVLYELTRINESLEDGWIGLIGISNELHFKEFLDPRVLSSLGEEELVFKPYTSDELYDILSQRATLAFRSDVLDEGALRLSAALAAGEHGDARRALDLLRVAGEIAERNREDKVVESHIRSAQQKVEHDRVTEVLESLPLHSRILMISVMHLENARKESSVTGDVYEVYRELAAVAAVEPLTQRRVSGLLNELDIMGILNARVVSFGRYGRTKKIRLGVENRAIANAFGGDEFVRGLLAHAPQSVTRRQSLR
ncbi:MAG TPA: orc1/cdc6 family replication initiation protein [Candidatus Bathyarchaeia archaeon]|nr:orc1/cdc6 family replication initiation protein [Candidatus Bathyarchaeia archaeon]